MDSYLHWRPLSSYHCYVNFLHNLDISGQDQSGPLLLVDQRGSDGTRGDQRGPEGPATAMAEIVDKRGPGGPKGPGGTRGTRGTRVDRGISLLIRTRGDQRDQRGPEGPATVMAEINVCTLMFNLGPEDAIDSTTSAKFAVIPSENSSRTS